MWRWKKNERTPTLYIDSSYANYNSIYEERRFMMWEVLLHSFYFLVGVVGCIFVFAIGCIIILALDAETTVKER